MSVLVRALRWTGALLLLAACGWPVAADDEIRFSRDIQPILSEHCFQCHGPDAQARKGELRLDVADGPDGALRSGATVIVPGQPEQSELIQRIVSADASLRMPPDEAKKPLSPEQIATLTKWIAAGAAWGQHWALEPPVSPPLPAVQQTTWSRGPLDRFVLARLEREQLSPSPEATRETLIRRLTLDLTGLPPEPADVDAFLADAGADAYERLVDRLLASPRYGERMAWDWLDASRYADTNGFQGDPVRTMWPWRDWVVQSFNRNQPFDQFTVEQLAGDLLPESTLEQRLATAFNRNHMFNGEGGRIAEETRVENVMDRTETTATIWLGLTFTCARCHNHKYDAITQQEYYQLYAFFNNSQENGGASGVGRSGQIAPVLNFADAAKLAKLEELKASTQTLEQQVNQAEAALREKQAAWEKDTAPTLTDLPEKIAAILKLAADQRTAEQNKELTEHYLSRDAALTEMRKQRDTSRQQRDELDASILRVMVMDESSPRETFVLTRGAYNKPDPMQKVVAGVPASLPKLAGEKADRLALARWLVDPSHPLTARVTVNRLWQALFGAGLVATAEDFGIQGEKPSHPELLDYLAVRFVQSGWDVKGLLKEIVTSATYRQSSRVTPQLRERDPENRLLARGPRHRLPSYTIRDQALAISGLMNENLSGPPVKPYQPAGVWEEATFGQRRYEQDHGSALYRRSLYIFWRRIVGPTMFFDTSARQTCTVRVARTNTPLHALVTLNDIAYVEAARCLAERVMQEAETPAERIAVAFRRATSRRPSQIENDILTTRFEALRKHFASQPDAATKLLAIGESPRSQTIDPIDHAAYAAVCSLILNLDETLSKQ